MILPQGLEFLPEHSINTAFLMENVQRRWNWKQRSIRSKIYRKLRFLIKKTKRKQKKKNLIGAFNPLTMDMPDYKDVKSAF